VKRNYVPISNDGSPTIASRIGKHTREREREREKERERDYGNLNKLTELERIQYFHRVKEKEEIFEQILRAPSNHD